MNTNYLAKSAAEQVGVNVLEIRMVENVERFQPELHSDCLLQLDVFEQRKVVTFNSRSFDAARRCISGTQVIGIDICKSSRIEPLSDCVWRSFIWIAELVGTRSRVGVRIQQAKPGGIGGYAGYSERQTRIESDNSGELPTAECVADEAFLCLEPRHYPNKVSIENVPAIEGGWTVVGVDIRIVLRRGKITACIGQRMRPGVIDVDERATLDPLLQAHLQ